MVSIKLATNSDKRGLDHLACKRSEHRSGVCDILGAAGAGDFLCCYAKFFANGRADLTKCRNGTASFSRKRG